MGIGSQARRVIELIGALRGNARIQPATDDVRALVDEATDPQGDRRIGAVTAIWLSTIWGR